VLLNLTVAGLLDNANAPLQAALDYVSSDAPDELVTALEPVAHGETPATLETSGYVVHSLQTALHDGLSSESAEEAVVAAVIRTRLERLRARSLVRGSGPHSFRIGG